MEKDFTKIVLNSMNRRILQYLLINKQGTVSNISSYIDDIPKPSLYRHIKQLSEAGLIEVISEKQIRGVIEKTYSIAKTPPQGINEENISQTVQKLLIGIELSFSEYFNKSSTDPQKDMLCVSSATLRLTDEEFISFLQKYGELVASFANAPKTDGQKTRSIYFISGPNLD